MCCAVCHGGDRWIIKTCLVTNGSRVRVCDHCYTPRISELVIVPGDAVVTVHCDLCGRYGNPREMAEFRPGGRKDAYAETCRICAMNISTRLRGELR
jgi:hypothetical protein